MQYSVILYDPETAYNICTLLTRMRSFIIRPFSAPTLFGHVTILPTFTTFGFSFETAILRRVILLSAYFAFELRST